MIKKMIIQDQKFPKQMHMPKTIIFDLSGVLLIKKNIDHMLCDAQATSSMVVVNFLETIALLKACKAAGHKLFVLSNLSIAEYDKIKLEPTIASMFSFFDDIIISDMTPYQKPDHQIFTYFCQQYNLQPTDCIFIDDKQINLDGAQAAAINKTILCSNFDLQHVRNELVSFGILHQNDALELNIPTGQA
jgi:FMN phosphatase YigB (HAD superfamily)